MSLCRLHVRINAAFCYMEHSSTVSDDDGSGDCNKCMEKVAAGGD